MFLSNEIIGNKEPENKVDGGSIISQLNEMHLDESFHLDHASRNSDFRFQLNSVAQLNFMT